MDITVTIKAPELVEAINNLAVVFSAGFNLQGAESIAVSNQIAATAQAQSPLPIQNPIPAVSSAPAVPISAPTPIPAAAPLPVPPATPAPIAPAPAVPTSAQAYTIEQLSVAAMQLMDANRQQDLVNLLNAFGVQALTMLPKEQYGTFATKLRELGAKI